MSTPNYHSPLALRPREAAKALGISPRLLWQLTKDGAIASVRVGTGKRKIVLYPVNVLEAWLTSQAKANEHDWRAALTPEEFDAYQREYEAVCEADEEEERRRRAEDPPADDLPGWLPEWWEESQTADDAEGGEV